MIYKFKTKHKLYKIHTSMIQRCHNNKSKHYKYYGLRGISVCERWRGEKGFQNFINDVGDRPEKTSLDRINNYGNYEPNNCRWATYKEQSANRRLSDKIKHECKKIKRNNLWYGFKDALMS